jgi:hypothetical protein
MSNLFTIDIPDNPAALLITYEAGALIRVQSCPTEAGAYADIPDPTLPIVTGKTTYAIYDADGAPNDFYKFRYEAADGNPVGTYSDAIQPVAETTVYASLATFKNFVRTESTDEDELLSMALYAASRAIDRHTNRTFSPTIATAEARYFSAFNGILTIDDLADDTDLLVEYDGLRDHTYSTTVTEYFLAPQGAPTGGKPYTYLTLRAPYSTSNGAFRVTGLWGWDSIPIGIQQATLLQASRIWARRNSPFGVAGSPDLGNELRLLAKLDPDVEQMVGDWRRWWAAA